MEAALLWNLLNLAGFGLSVYAAWAATSAKTAAREAAAAVVSKKNELEDRDRLRALIAVLNTAKEAAMRRQAGAPESMSAGHDRGLDLQALRNAHDALLTRLPLDFADGLRADAQSAAEELQKALENIENVGANRDGWKDACSTLQVLIPRLEQEERRQRDEELMALVKN
ncbi:MAG: hypothetical protein EOQ98_04005 [Mesorhizobium sp.]|uniref:hypothetical protein n=1 Tax=Mesorhizobium sp. TaxID=1871066 RepID=UPI000FE4FAD1|nr:hypothetical protein [Mesorhizobium sp.]RWP02386.1 MAG: hypothetical protein EOQ98_04005 [Mesorhizobium sp.]TIM39067.1 MAG: hypothetical protein E5Y69_13185 [Mesorhizobium sp.]